MREKSELHLLRPGKREAKKVALRAAIVKLAHTAFSKRGFDNVTVAEIAQAAGVSVKTLFQYFDAKEDIVFEGEMDLAKDLGAAITARSSGRPILNAAVARIVSLIKDDEEDSLKRLEGFAQMTGNPVLKSRLQIMWAHYEEHLTTTIASDLAVAGGDPRPRLLAMQIVGLLRLLTSEEARVYLRNSQSSSRSLVKWLNAAVRFLSTELREYGARK